MTRKYNMRAATGGRPAAILPLRMQGRACRGKSDKWGMAPVAALSAVVILTALAPSRANALEAYSALAFRNSIGVNSVLSETGSDSRYSAAKDALREIGIVNHRAKLTPFNAGRARDLFSLPASGRWRGSTFASAEERSAKPTSRGSHKT